MKSACEGAQTSLHCILSDGLENGGYFAECAQDEPHSLVKNKDACAKVWDLSYRLAKVNDARSKAYYYNTSHFCESENSC